MPRFKQCLDSWISVLRTFLSKKPLILMPKHFWDSYVAKKISAVDLIIQMPIQQIHARVYVLILWEFILPINHYLHARIIHFIWHLNNTISISFQISRFTFSYWRTGFWFQFYPSETNIKHLVNFLKLVKPPLGLQVNRSTVERALVVRS